MILALSRRVCRSAPAAHPPRRRRAAPPPARFSGRAAAGMAQQPQAGAAGGLRDEAREVLTYWLGETMNEIKFGLWFASGDAQAAVDAEVRARFGPQLAALRAGGLDAWAAAPAAAPLDALAAVIVGDQLTRNAYRGTAAAFADDARVRRWAGALLDAPGAMAALAPLQRTWVFLPLMHSEALADQERCVALYKALAVETAAAAAAAPGDAAAAAVAKFVGSAAPFAEAHRDVVARWGRFPHRNAFLGRESTPEEAAGLADGTIPRW